MKKTNQTATRIVTWKQLGKMSTRGRKRVATRAIEVWPEGYIISITRRTNNGGNYEI